MEEREKIKITGYTSSKGKDYIKLHIKKYKHLLDVYMGNDISFLKKIYISIDFCMAVIFEGAGINDYFQYNFYYRKHSDRKRFIVGRKWIRMIKKCNGSVKNDLFDNKILFNQKFDYFLNRGWLDMRITNFEEFRQFFEEKQAIITKFPEGSGGNGISKEYYDAKKVNELFRKLKNEGALVEECIQQHQDLSAFNPSSLNTLRVVTIHTGDEVKVMNAVIRMGNGNKFTDNFHQYGLAAIVDENSGIVISPAVNKNNEKYYVHPVSQKQIIGYQIPLWNKIIEEVRKAAKVLPRVRYVGWDIAIDKNNNICIIEGNCASDPDIVQMTDQIGKWPKYQKVLAKLENL